MCLEKLYIYETIHNADSVDENLRELREWGISPDFVGLELPVEGETELFWPALKLSPGTGLSMYLTEWYTNERPPLLNQGRSTVQTEFTAGRQFAEEFGAQCEDVDRERELVVREALLIKQRLTDAGVVLYSALALVLLSVFIAAVGLLCVYSVIALGSGEHPYAALAFTVFLAGAVAVGLNPCRRWWMETVSGPANNFKSRIRTKRDEFMFYTLQDYCANEGHERALIIAGNAHSPGLQQYAEADGVSVETRSAPAAEDIEVDEEGEVVSMTSE